MGRSFEDLIAEAESAPIEGWHFSWLDGRATEERPTWGYSKMLAERLRGISAFLDLQTGGGELLSRLPNLPALTVATEGWEPNVMVAGRRLRPLSGWVVAAQDERLPFGNARFELVASRHPIVTPWDEIARVLRLGGSFFSQQVGPRSVGELTEFMIGPQPANDARDPERMRIAAEDAGLTVVDLRQQRLRTEFHDVGAVVYFLRLVVWTVPGFTVEKYRERLRALHGQIQAKGPFVAHATRFLIEAKKPEERPKGGMWKA